MDRLTEVFKDDVPLRRLEATELISPPHPWQELQSAISSFRELQEVRQRLQELANQTSLWAKIGIDKKFAAAWEKFGTDFPAVWTYARRSGLNPKKLLAQVDSLLDTLYRLQGDAPYAMEFVYSLARQPADFASLAADLADLNSLRFHHLLSAAAPLSQKDKQELTLRELSHGLAQLQDFTRFSQASQDITEFQEAVGLAGMSPQNLYLQLDRLQGSLESLQPQTIKALKAVKDLSGPILQRVGIDFSNLASLAKLSGLTQDETRIMEFIALHAELGREEAFLPEIRGQLELESYGYHFLRINKFTLRPRQAGETRVDRLNNLLTRAFAA